MLFTESVEETKCDDEPDGKMCRWGADLSLAPFYQPDRRPDDFPYLKPYSANSLILLWYLSLAGDMSRNNTVLVKDQSEGRYAGCTYDPMLITLGRGEDNHPPHKTLKGLLKNANASIQKARKEGRISSHQWDVINFDGLFSEEIITELLTNIPYAVDRSVLYLTLQQAAPAVSSAMHKEILSFDVDGSVYKNYENNNVRLSKISEYEQKNKYDLYSNNLSAAREVIFERYASLLKSGIAELKKVEKRFRGNPKERYRVGNKIRILEQSLNNFYNYKVYTKTILTRLSDISQSSDAGVKKELYSDSMSMVNAHYSDFMRSIILPWVEYDHTVPKNIRERMSTHYYLTKAGYFSQDKSLSANGTEYSILHTYMFPEPRNIPNAIKLEIINNSVNVERQLVISKQDFDTWNERAISKDGWWNALVSKLGY